jgi:hypothetical protein
LTRSPPSENLRFGSILFFRSFGTLLPYVLTDVGSSNWGRTAVVGTQIAFRTKVRR